MSRPAAGAIVIVDWRGGSLPQEPSKLPLAVVVEDDELFPDQYPTTLVVPMTRDQGLAHGSFSERIEPDPGNGVDAICWALSHHVTSVSMRRVTITPSRVTSEQLASIRQRIDFAIGIG